MAPSRLLRQFLIPLALLALAGCASTVPAAIRTAPSANPSLSAVRADAKSYLGKHVRWGGTIAAVDNGAKSTTLDVVERPLYGDGEPKQTDRSEGRFMVRLNRFLDPAIYAEGRRVTVTGTISGTETHNVDQYPYTFVRIDADFVYLWPRELPLSAYDRPYFYDPWYYDPWYYPSPLYPWRYRP